MQDAKWIRLQASTRCLACAEITAVNAALEQLSCAGCGAAFTLREELWQSALTEARSLADDLEANATTSRSFDVQGMTLKLAISAVDATCPHCDAAWNQLPDRACPACATAVSVRPYGPGTLVGEDSHMLAGDRRQVVPQTLSCSGCGSPLSAQGTTRTLVCGSCTRETVIPDEIWRRLHAPRAVASWYLFAGGTTQPGLRRRLQPIDLVASSGRLFALAYYPDAPNTLMAVQIDPLAIDWMIDLSARAGQPPTALTVRGGELSSYKYGSRAIEIFDANTGAHIRTLTAPKPILDMAADPDGSLVCQTMADGLIRIDAQGNALPLWPEQGWAARIFRRDGSVEGPPSRRMASVSGGRIGMGHDKELRVIAGDSLGRLGRDGELRWSVRIPGVNVAVVAPAAAADGTTWAVFRTVGGSMTAEQLMAQVEAMAEGHEQSSCVLVRVSADGVKIEPVRCSGVEEYTMLAVTPEGEVWLATGVGEVLRLAASGELLWRQAAQGENADDDDDDDDDDGDDDDDDDDDDYD
jgi:outer membrane protein assembly factor BamB